MAADLKRLPLSMPRFSTLRRENRIYVDKTELVFSLAEKNQQFFLSRPRRFGKSLLVTTFASLFQFGLRDFKGLAIEKLWKDTTYNVVRLDFSRVKNFGDSFEDFENKYRWMLANAFGKLGFVLRENTTEPIEEQLSAWMEDQADGSLVLLVDEYDSPLTACLHNPALFDRVQSRLADFYAQVKSNAGMLRFFFMTGITKMKQTGIFSEFTDLIDITLRSDYGTLLGYTEEEILSYFGDYIEDASLILRMKPSDVMQALRRNYDGYCFDDKVSSHVYTPWSVLNFLNCPGDGFRNYWFETGGISSSLINYFKSHALRDPAEFQDPKHLSREVLAASTGLSALSDVALLTQAGYLTIKDYRDGEFSLGYPNEEVKASMGALYSGMLLKGKTLSEVKAGNIVSLMAKDTPDAVITGFNRMFMALDYVRYPIIDEAACRGYLQAMLCGAGVYAQVEVHNALGRSDLVVDAGNRRWIFELKYLAASTAKSEALKTRLLAEAEKQIQSRRYGEQDVSGRELMRIAAVFSEKERQIVSWTTVPQQP